jgi:hypothetical protein
MRAYYNRLAWRASNFSIKDAIGAFRRRGEMDSSSFVSGILQGFVISPELQTGGGGIQLSR